MSNGKKATQFGGSVLFGEFILKGPVIVKRWIIL